MVENIDIYQLRIYTYSYEYKSTHLDLLNNNYNCINIFYGVKTNFIYEKDLLSFSCISSDTVVQSILFYNNLNIVQTNNQFALCENINGHSVIYSHYIISDVVCYNHQLTFFPLISDIPNIIEEEEEEKNEKVEEEKEKEERYEESYEEEKEKEIIKEKENTEKEKQETDN